MRGKNSIKGINTKFSKEVQSLSSTRVRVLVFTSVSIYKLLACAISAAHIAMGTMQTAKPRLRLCWKLCPFSRRELKDAE